MGKGAAIIWKNTIMILVGSGLYAGVFAWYAKKQGKTCLVLEKRDHIGGNIYCEDVEDIHVHKYGAHIFHTSNKKGVGVCQFPGRV